MKNLPLIILIVVVLLGIALYNFPITTLLLIIAALVFVIVSLMNGMKNMFRR